MEQQKQFYTSQEAKPIIDPDLRDFLPPISDEERENLKADILQNGCYSPLICMEDMTLVDGHHRHAICEEHGVEFSMRVLKFEDKLAAKEWMVNTQKGRRNLTTYQLGQIALRLKPEFEERARKNKLAAMEKARKQNENNVGEQFSATLRKTVAEPVDTLKSIGNSVGIGESSMNKINQIDLKAPSVVKAALDRNLISVNKAYKITKEVENLPEEEREQKATELFEQDNRKHGRRVREENALADAINKILNPASRLDASEEAVRVWARYCCLDARGLRQDSEQARKGAENLTLLAENMYKIYLERKHEIDEELERQDQYEG